MFNWDVGFPLFFFHAFLSKSLISRIFLKPNQLLRWPTSVRVKEKFSRQKKNARDKKEIGHGKRKNLVAKEKDHGKRKKSSWQNRNSHGKIKKTRRRKKIAHCAHSRKAPTGLSTQKYRRWYEARSILCVGGQPRVQIKNKEQAKAYKTPMWQRIRTKFQNILLWRIDKVSNSVYVIIIL